MAGHGGTPPGAAAAITGFTLALGLASQRRELAAPFVDGMMRAERDAFHAAIATRTSPAFDLSLRVRICRLAWQERRAVARVMPAGPGWSLAGAAVFRDAGGPARLEYLLRCDAHWRTRSGRVHGWIGATAVDLVIEAGGDGRWRVNGAEATAVTGCVDLDLRSPCRRCGSRRCGSVISASASASIDTRAPATIW